MTKIWITKYALTEGIYTEEAELLERTGLKVDVFFCEKHQDGVSYTFCYYLHEDCEITLDAALEQATSLRDRKIASLQQEIDKLTSEPIKVIDNE